MDNYVPDIYCIFQGLCVKVVIYVWLEEVVTWKDGLKFVSVAFGEQFVMIIGMTLMP